MKGNQSQEALVKYLDVDLKEVLSDEQRERVFALSIAAVTDARKAGRRETCGCRDEVVQEQTVANRTVAGWIGGATVFSIIILTILAWATGAFTPS